MPNQYNTLDKETINFTSTTDGVDVNDTREIEWRWTSTDTANQPSMHTSSIVHLQNTSNSQSIVVALEGLIEYESSSDVTGNGHLIGLIGQVKHQGTGTVAALYPVEARFDMESSGDATIAANILVTTGNLAAGAVVTNFYGVYMPDMSGLTNYSNLGTTTKLSWYSATPGLTMLNVGDIQTGGKFIGTSVTSGSTQNVCELQSHNSVNGGTKIQYTIDTGGTPAIGYIENQLISGTRSDINLALLVAGTETEVLQINGITLTSGDTHLGVRYHNGTSATTGAVTLGAADSGGSGYKVLRVPN